MVALMLSLVTWIIRSYTIDIPHEIEDAVRIDRASDLRIVATIVIDLTIRDKEFMQTDVVERD